MYIFSFLRKWPWKGVKISFSSFLTSPVGVSKKRLQFCEWRKVFKPYRFDDLTSAPPFFTFHSTWGLRAANSPHHLPKQSPLSLTAGLRILHPVHWDRCQATGALLPDSRAPETADMDWISPRTTLTQPRLQAPRPPWCLSAKHFGGSCVMLKKTVSYESYWRLATQGEGKVGASGRSGIFKVGLSVFVQPLIEMLMIKCNQQAFLVACLWLCAISTIVKADECDWEPVFSLIYGYNSLGKTMRLVKAKSTTQTCFSQTAQSQTSGPCTTMSGTEIQKLARRPIQFIPLAFARKISVLTSNG